MPGWVRIRLQCRASRSRGESRYLSESYLLARGRANVCAPSALGHSHSMNSSLSSSARGVENAQRSSSWTMFSPPFMVSSAPSRRRVRLSWNELRGWERRRRQDSLPG